MGPRAQQLLAPLLTAEPEGFVFSPRRAERDRMAARRSGRQTKLWPSHVRHQARNRKTAPNRFPKERYEQASYRRAIRRACVKAGVPVWHPHQLRHTRLTELRRQYGLETAQACGGHRDLGVTQIYAERARNLAIKAMAEIG
jgi:integrase